MSEIFKAYDIRGLYPSEFNEDWAYRIARAFAALRQQELGRLTLRLAVGQDMRISSPSLKAAVAAGLSDSGVQIVDIGLVSTPTFYFGVAYFNYDGGLMVSASHNPARYNGLKLVRSKASPVGINSGLATVKQLALANKFAKVAEHGQLEANGSVLETELKTELPPADLQGIKPFKIVADTANGMGSLYLEALFKKLPCQLIKMFWELDGSFPNHEADPLKEENLQWLKDRVIREEADLGIATDGDGDRIFFVDNEGQTIEPAIIRGLLAKIFLRQQPGAKIGYDIRPGRITRDLIEEAGGQPVITRVGHSLIKDQMLKEGIYFSGESSGHYFLNQPYGCFEMPLIVTAKLLKEFSDSGQTVADQVRPYRRYHNSGEINSQVKDPAKVLAKLKKQYQAGQQSGLDGLSVEYADWWFNVRASNTEPLLRLSVEAPSQDLMAAKRDELLKLIRG